MAKDGIWGSAIQLISELVTTTQSDFSWLTCGLPTPSAHRCEHRKRCFRGIKPWRAQVCNHPYLLHHTRPEEEEECEVVGVSTKWQLLDRLVPRLAAARHRTLILTQSPKALDLVQVRRPLTERSTCLVVQSPAVSSLSVIVLWGMLRRCCLCGAAVWSTSAGCVCC